MCQLMKVFGLSIAATGWIALAGCNGGGGSNYGAPGTVTSTGSAGTTTTTSTGSSGTVTSTGTTTTVSSTGSSGTTDPSDPVGVIGCASTGGCPIPPPVILPPGPPVSPPTPPHPCALDGQQCGPIHVTTPVDSIGQGTKDTSLQQADVEQQALTARANSLVNRFQMSFQAATQLTQLADQIQSMATVGQGELTAADRTAVTQSALGIAGLTPDQVNDAVTQGMQGNDAPTEAVLETAAQNLGMPSASALRDQLLPALGINLN